MGWSICYKLLNQWPNLPRLDFFVALLNKIFSFQHARLVVCVYMDEQMAKIKAADFTGYSELGIEEAIQDALDKAGDYDRVEIVETRGSQANGDNRQYHVTLTAFSE